MKKISLLKNLGLISLLLFVTGCALTRSVVPVDVAVPIGNPINGIDVKIVSVEDDRDFQVRPKTPDVPSLSENEVINESVKARAIGRKRNGYGAAIGDVLLPEGQTVADVIKSSLSNSFRQAGYRVLGEGDANYDTALPISVKMTQFWSWIEMGFWQGKLHNDSEVIIKGPIDKLKNGITVSNQQAIPVSMVRDDEWQKSASEGAAGLANNVAKELKK